ncbi:MAG: squalene--hopene cyclase [Verrucomicrobia bacterium]|nr:squalene--hopene cyclase [Verrucomicrobiota bacterium]
MSDSLGYFSAIALALIFISRPILAQDSVLRFGGQIPPEVETIYERGLAWLASKQSEKGDWEDGNRGSGLTGICLMSFLASGQDPNFGQYAPNIRRAVRAIINDQEEKTGFLPSTMYHHGFAMLGLSEAYGAVDETLLWQEGTREKRRSISEALKLAVKLAVTSQDKNKWGGWRYNPTSDDADTSVTGAVLMGLLAARNAGIEVPDQSITKALEYMQRSTGKDGSVAYSGGIGGGMGESVNRSAIATLVMAVGRHKDWDQFKAALKHITGQLEHRDSSYPEYNRYYMAQALFQGDYEAWQKWNGALVRQFRQTQNADGSFANGSYGTGMSLLALALNFRFLPIYER